MLSRKSSSHIGLDTGLPMSNDNSRKSSVIINNPKTRKKNYPTGNNGYDTNRSFSLNNNSQSLPSTPNTDTHRSFSNFNVFQRNGSSTRNDNYIEKEIDKFNMMYGSNNNSRKPSIMKKLRNFSAEVVDEINDKKIINKKLTLSNFIWGLIIFAILFWILIIKPLGYLFGSTTSLTNFENMKFLKDFSHEDLYMTSGQSQVSKFENDRFSLRLPYLDTLDNNYYITGSPIIKNTKYVRLLEKGVIGKHSVILSKSTLPSDFEIQMSLSLEPGSFKLKKQVANKRAGDGFTIFFTQESDEFVTKYPTSQEDRNRILKETGVDTRNVDLMGIPKNLKSDNIVLDFFENGEVVNNQENDKRWNGLKTPHLSCLSVSSDGNEYNYLDDGLSIAHDMISLDQKSVFTDKGLLEFDPNKFKLRIIRVSSLLFKIDIDYTGTGKDWQELMRFENLGGRNRIFETFVKGGANLRFGIAALNGEQTANFQINELRVYNYLWENPADLIGDDDLKLEYLLDLYRREVSLDDRNGWFDLNSLYRKQGLLPRDYNQKQVQQKMKTIAQNKKEQDKTKVLSNEKVTGNKMNLNANNNNNNSENKSGKIISIKSIFTKLFKLIIWLLVLGIIAYIVNLFQRVQRKKMRKMRVSSRSADLL